MSIFIILILLIIAAFIVFFTGYFRVQVIFDAYKSNLNMTVTWLHSFIKAIIYLEGLKPVLSFYVWNKRIFKKYLMKGREHNSASDLIKVIDSKEVNVDAGYGFRDPSITGIFCGIANAVTQFINIDSIRLRPDFVAENDYVYLNANAKVNIGSTLISYLRLKKKEEI